MPIQGSLAGVNTYRKAHRRPRPGMVRLGAPAAQDPLAEFVIHGAFRSQATAIKDQLVGHERDRFVWVTLREETSDMSFKRPPALGAGQGQVPLERALFFRPTQRGQADCDIPLQATQALAFTPDPRP